MIQEHKKTFWFLGIYFLIIEILFIFKLMIDGHRDFSGLVWICNISPAFFALAFFTKNKQFIKGIINLAFMPQILFVIVTIMYFSLGISIFAIDKCYINFLEGFTAFYMHLFSVSIAMFFTRKIAPLKKSIYYSMILFFFIFILTILFTSKETNANYIYSTTALLGFNIPFINIIWPILIFLGFVLPAYYFQKYIYKKQKIEKII